MIVTRQSQPPIGNHEAGVESSDAADLPSKEVMASRDSFSSARAEEGGRSMEFDVEAAPLTKEMLLLYVREEVSS